MSGPDPWSEPADWGPVAVYTSSSATRSDATRSDAAGSEASEPHGAVQDDLGAPGSFGGSDAGGPVWSTTTYSGPRRHRPRADGAGAPPVPPTAAVGMDGAATDIAAPDVSPVGVPAIADSTAPPEPVSDEEAGPRDREGSGNSGESTGNSSLLRSSPTESSAGVPRSGESTGNSSLLRSSPTESSAGVPRSGESTGNSSLLRSSRTMAVASLASRITGFLRSVALAAALGVATSRVADSYNLANILPNMVYELLLGGVLSSVVIPLIVSAQEHDRDGGDAYTQRLLSWAVAALGLATLLAVAAAPLLAAAFAESGPQRSLISIFATLLLPEIFFYGLGAMFTAVLNTRGVYGPSAWAPVLNNVVTIAAVGAFAFLPGPSVLTESSITTTQILVLGVGTTLGIAAQALVLIPSLRRVGFHFRWRFRATGAETVRMGEVRTLALWVLGYVAISQVGVFVINRVANRTRGGPTTFAYADLLFQVPYGIIGVSLLTALMPRMSRSAARGDDAAVIADLSLGARLSAVGLLPITAGLIVMGPSLTTVLFFYGRTDLADARAIGIVLALGAFGLLPFAIVMLQLRVFYAMRDARTPTVINVFMVATKVVVVLLAAAAFDGRRVIESLSVATSLSYLAGAIVGYVLLRRRFGTLDLARVGRTVAVVLGCSVVGALGAWGVVELSRQLIGAGRGAAVLAVVGGSVLGGVIAAVALRASRLPEVRAIVESVGGRGRG